MNVERWGRFELRLRSDTSHDNPFVDVELRACFTHDGNEQWVDGFYDGEQNWVIRYMPGETGEYRFVTSSSDPELDAREGAFLSVDPGPGNRGPVRVRGRDHFAYADGTPYFAMGATVYAWFYRPEEIRRRTLESLEKHRFTKARMLVFPKHIKGIEAADLSYDPPIYPYEGEKNAFDFRRFVPEYFREYEKRIDELASIGVEADVILFHQYDSGMWGLDQLNDEEALLYLRYMLARLGSFRNVWWSLANEYNIIQRSRWRDWDGIGNFLMENDPYGHMRSIHNWTFGPIYPDRAWMTHVCYQNPNTYQLLMELKRSYGKPVINDEYEYEGNLPYNWGNSGAELTLHRHWLSAMAGGYGTHGECFAIDGNIRDIFWTYGGTITGQSAPRLAFLRTIIESVPYWEMVPDLTLSFDLDVCCLRRGTDLYLYYCRAAMPGKRLSFGTESGSRVAYEVTTYDVWNCRETDSRIVTHPKEIEATEWTVMILRKL